MMQVFGALKWRVAHTALTKSETGRSLWSLTEITTLGSLGSQFLPAQLSHLMVRWFYFPKAGSQRVGAASSTLYEQFCDLILFAVFSAVFLLWFWLGLPLGVILLLGLMMLLFSCTALNIAVGLIEQVIRALGRIGPLSGALVKAEALAAQSRDISPWTNVRIFLLSGAIIFIRAAQAYLIVRIFAQDANALIAAAAFPVTGLIAAIPISPAGLGVTELSWSVFLIAAGADAPAAAITAVSIRLINLIVLIALLGLSFALHFTARVLDLTRNEP